MESKNEIILTLLSKGDQTIRDAVWGDIILDSKALQLLDSVPFQRLRRVQQLGFISWVWPGAHHTRFEHSLGVFHLTRQVFLHLLLKTSYNFTAEEINTALAAALLHDIGHYPFSHAVEELDLNIIRNHELIGSEIVKGPEIGNILYESWGINPEKVSAFLVGDADNNLSPRENLLRTLLSGSLDTDKLDYLIRDSRYCNVPYGMVDVQRLIDSITIWPESPTDNLLPLQFVLNEKGIGALQSLIFARYLMFFNVYWHHTNRIATVMFLRSLQEALLSNCVNSKELESSDDASIINLIRNSTEPLSISNELINDLRNRRFYKRALAFGEDSPFFELLATLKFDPSRRKRLEELWCRHVASWIGRPLRGHELLLDIPEPKSFEINVNVLSENPPPDWRNPIPWGLVSGLDSADLRKFHSHVRKVVVVAKDNEIADAVRDKRNILLDLVTSCR